MPKFPKGFGRRKSAANVLEDVQDAPVAEHTFKVFERPEGSSKSFDGGVKFARAAAAASSSGRPKTSHKEDNMFEDIITTSRGSGASNSNTASTTDNSSRLSAASTAPSSTDVAAREDWRSPHDKPFNDIPIPPIPKNPSPFSLKSAGRSLSWGRNNKSTDSSQRSPPLPVEKDSPPSRSRAVTASSYASTATPPTTTSPQIEDSELGLNLGGDFGNMFSGFDKRKSALLLQSESRAMSHSPEMQPTGSGSRSYLASNTLPPINIDRNKEIEPSPYSWGSQNSPHDRLMSNTSPPPFSPPQILRYGVAPQNEGNSNRPQKPGGLADTGLRSTSGNAGRQSTVDYDEDAKLLQESINASRKLNDPSFSPKVRDSWALPSDRQLRVDDATISSWNVGSTDTTPRAKKATLKPSEDSLFDSNISASADLAQRFQEQSNLPRPSQAPQNKVMTPAQFERYRQDRERFKGISGHAKDEEDEEDEENYDEDDDEVEKNKQLAKQRRKQEAHMAVYRQQMMKVTGDSNATGPMRPGAISSQSTPNLLQAQPEDVEEEDEEVPLGILQAHGFPNKGKPPMRSMGSNPNLRAQSVVPGADGRLPVFARHLPQDPYFGAGIVHPSNRESLAFGGGASSVQGGSSRGLPPGGLVGVIATEERSRAMRRGSPNPPAEYGPPPANGFNGMGMPGMGPMGPMGMNPMMMTPGDQAQMQMSQQMQQFMQMQMQFMQMMTSGQGSPQQNGHSPQPSLGQLPTLNLQNGRPGSSHQRAMTMMDPNTAPWMQGASTYAPSVHAQGAGYAPSIAPSERSNIGLPGRYRPVSNAPPQDSKSRASSMMSGALHSWENKTGSSTVKVVKKAADDEEEDDEEGWEEMAKKREKKKSMWRTKKDSHGLKDLLGFAQ